MNDSPQLLSVGFNDEGVILYRTDEHDQPLMLAIMDTTAAIRYAGDLCDTAERLMKAAEDFAEHRKLVAAVNDSFDEQE